jgi:hypothetical protein
MDQLASAPQQTAPSNLCQKIDGITKVVVAIHGIGNQTRSSTIRYVVRQFGDRRPKKLPLMPLGYFHIGPGVESVVSRLPVDPKDPLEGIGFVEVFWADIPRGIVEKKDTLEETKAWGRTIVSQAEGLYGTRIQSGAQLRPRDFALAGGVVDEVVEAISVLENLSAVAEKAGFFKFDLAPLLRDYVDDVQVVTEFEHFRREILLCFHKTMSHIEKVFKDCGRDPPEIYIVAHSEGTVISFLGLLEALAGIPIDGVSHSWVDRVRGYMTIGSPIDKHLILWPRLWNHVRGRLAVDKADKIKWRNYYDFGDPVGFELDTAREFLLDEGCTAFEFEKKHDIGFARYPLPGKAHNDYWQDAEVFGHFIDDVVSPAKDATAPPKPPANKNLMRLSSRALPYLLVFLVHAGAVYALFKGVSGFYLEKPKAGEFAPQMLVLGFFFMIVTIAARLPRLTRSFASRWFEVLALLILSCGSLFALHSAAEFVGNAVAKFVTSPLSAVDFGRISVAAFGLIVVLAGWAAPRKPRWGRQCILWTGGVLMAIVVISNFNDATAKDPEMWPAVLGSAGFLYLWWLGILLFDLTFIWHRYVRDSVAIKALSRWSPYYRESVRAA